MAKQEWARALYENNALIKRLNHNYPRAFRAVWELYLKALQFRYRDSLPPLHPTTPLLQARRWKIPQYKTSGNDSDPRILFFSFTGWSKNIVQDALLGQALAMRGAQVAYFTCGGSFPLCYIHNASSNVPPMPCGRCRAYADSGLGAFGFTPQMMNDVISASEQDVLKAQIDSIPDTLLTSYEMDGIRLGYYASVSARWFLLTNNVDDSAEMMERLRGFIYLGALAYTAIQRLIQQFKPDKIVMFNGLHAPERMVQEAAVRHGIPYVCTERGYMVNTLYATHNMPCAGYPLDGLWSMFRDTPLSEGQNAVLDEYLHARRYGGKLMDNLWEGVRADETTLRSEVGLIPGRRTVAAFTNVQGDTAVIDKDLAYPDLRDWIDGLIACFRQRPEIDLVFRIHPAETRMKRYTPRTGFGQYIAERHPDLPSHIKVIPSASTLSSYTLAGLSDLVMVYTSTVGLETTLMGKHSAVSGMVHYRDKGFTLDIRTPDDMELWVRRWQAGELPPVDLELARRYAYMFFYRAMIPLDDIIEETTFGQMRLKLGGIDGLRLGQSKALDSICDSILSGAQFVNPTL